jgi:molybdopterin/thiamine biosynthesis adenylyltransferase
MTTFKELLQRVRRDVREVSPDEAYEALARGARLVDVREADEWAQGHPPDALHVPRGLLELRIETAEPDKDRELVVLCAGGTRSAFAARTLQELGYTNVASLRGGFARWEEVGLPVEVPRPLTAEQRLRYSRHLRVPEVGEAGQERLLGARVLLVGAGGLGSPAALYLAAAGVGTLGIADFDVVDLSNLQRQVLHTSAAVGQPKTASAAATIAALNPDVQVVRHDARLDASNVLDVVGRYDVVIDGCDNFATKYLVGDAAWLAGKPNVYASIFRFDGQASVFVPGQGPCYRCLFPEPPPAGAAPSCDEAGVLGVLPGLLGLVQATEALKLLLGKGETLRGRLLTYDALRMTFREHRLRPDPRCALCGKDATIHAPQDLDITCRLEPATATA